jgi:peptide chain release factor 2
VRDFSDDLADLRRRLSDAHGYLHIDEARARLVELEKEASDPALWDDPDAARKVTTELSRVKDDVDVVDGLERRLSDLETLDELAREESDESLEDEIASGVAGLDRDLATLDLQASSPATTTNATPSARSTRAPAGPMPPTGPT